MAYVSNTPANINERFSTSQPKITANFQEINTAFSIDHVAFNDASQGKHQQLTIPNTTVVPATTPPATSATEVMLYSVGQELFFRPASQAAGTVASDINLTGGTLAASGACTLPCGLKMRWGISTISAHTNSQAVVFSSAFSTAVYSVQLTPTNAFAGGSNPQDFVLATDAVAVAGFTASRDNRWIGPAAQFYYIALGV